MHCVHAVLDRVFFAQRVARLGLAKRLEAKIDSGDALDDFAITLPRIPRTQSLKEASVDLDSYRPRMSHRLSVSSSWTL